MIRHARKVSNAFKPREARSVARCIFGGRSLEERKELKRKELEGRSFKASN